MANLKLSELPAASALTGEESIPVVQGGQTLRTTSAAVADLLKGQWQAVVLDLPWMNQGGDFAAAAYRQDGDRVELRGVVTGGDGGGVLFTLPQQQRPLSQRVFAATADTATPARLMVRANGDVLLEVPAGSAAAWYALDGVSYSID